jgi:phage/plasmid-associated DNA primase
MTTCTPLKAFRCWQYRKDSTEPVPDWVKSHYWFPYASDGYWFVDVGGHFCSYSPAEFAKRFKVVESNCEANQAEVRKELDQDAELFGTGFAVVDEDTGQFKRLDPTKVVVVHRK